MTINEHMFKGVTTVMDRPDTPPSSTASARQTAVLLLVCSIAVILTGLLHPASGAALLRPGSEVGPVWYAAHLIGTGVWPVFLVGFAQLARRLRDAGGALPASLGLAAAAFAAGSAVGSGLLGGFVRPRLAAEYIAATGVDRPVLASIYDYNTTVNEVFADAYQVSFATALALFAVALLLSRNPGTLALGWVGAAGGAVVAISSAFGLLSVHAADFHVFVIVNVGFAVWVAALAAHLIRRSPRTTTSAS